jgi:starch-binding outer membrane protein SusE/F
MFYMKSIFSKMLAAIMLVGVFASCQKNEEKAFYQGGTKPVLQANKTTIALSFINKDNEAVNFSWTNPNYKFNSGVSSQNVNYALEIDKAGTNFNSGKKQTISLVSDLSKSLTQSELNDILLNQLQLVPSVSSSIEVRTIATVNGNAATQLISNTLVYTVTPYAIPPKVTPPASGKLFLVGDATVGGWANPVPVPTQEFTRVNPTLYEITVPMNNGTDKAYLMLPVNGDWGAKFGCDGGNKSNDANSYDLKNGGGDVLAPSVSGTYKISVDFQRGKVSVTKL